MVEKLKIFPAFKAIILLAGLIAASCNSGNVDSDPEKMLSAEIEKDSGKTVAPNKPQDSPAISNPENKPKVSDSAMQLALLEQGICITIPSGFSPAAKNVIVKKYPQESRQPQILYVSKDETADVAFNYTPIPVRIEELPLLKTKLEESFQASIVNVISSKIDKLNGKEFIIQEYISPSEKGNVYNLSYIGILRGQLIMCNFNYLQAQAYKWEKVSKETMNSISLLQ
jgi:hypothetical protein